MYTCEYNKGHVDVYKNGEFVFTADTMKEAEEEIRELEKP